MPTGAEQDTIDQYWSRYFDCEIQDLYAPGTRVFEHREMRGYRGVFVFRHGDACIVSAPPEMLASLRSRMERLEASDVFDQAFLQDCFATILDRLVGPAWLAYAGSKDLRPVDAAGARLLEDGDIPALRRLAAACDETAWTHSGPLFDRPPIFGRFLENDIVAAAGYELWGEHLAHIGVVTHPDFHGRGFGKAVVSTAALYVLEHRLIAQYRTLESNTPSMAIGAALGFQHYASTIAVRLTGTVL